MRASPMTGVERSRAFGIIESLVMLILLAIFTVVVVALVLRFLKPDSDTAATGMGPSPARALVEPSPARV